jgi:CRP-like cAMP-binding protein
MEAVQARPVTELLECPAAVGLLLNEAARNISFAVGEVVFSQSEGCKGLYLVVSGRFQCQRDQQGARLTLSAARPGKLLELAAVLSDCHHAYTLTAQTAGSMVLLPKEALYKAFQSYPPLRMRLLEELAREVCRAYIACCLSCDVNSRQGTSAA